MPTIRFEDIYFADHYNYIYCSYFLIFCSSLHNVTNWENFRHMLVYVKWNDTTHVRFGIRPRRGDDLNKLIYRCDASVSLI